MIDKNDIEYIRFLIAEENLKLLGAVEKLSKKEIEDLKEELNSEISSINLVEGPIGPPGIPGPQGERGFVGEEGPSGPQGVQGLQGVQGPQGERGERGDIGEKGPPGPPGPKGDTGFRGERGEQGLQGPEGPQGLKGDSGPKGKTGDTGAKGDKGDKGDPGSPGKDGKNGIAGKQGKDGKPGKIGPKGPKGDPGKQGPMGEQGPAGPPGKSVLLEELQKSTVDPLLKKLQKDFNVYKQKMQVQLGTLGGGGSSKILDMDDVVYHHAYQLDDNDILVFKKEEGKFDKINITTLINNVRAEINVQYMKYIDQANNVIYVGEAEPGSANNDSAWRIQRIINQGSEDYEVLWAGGTANTEHQWSNRYNYTYS